MNKKDSLKNITPCQHINAKNSFGMIENSDSWSGINDPNATYWCNNTGGPVGPDNRFVSPSDCVSGRNCYRTNH